MNTIFVSSTFQDMQQERDVLQNVVLPRIKELAKQYGKSIDLCDLRWGVNTLGMSEEESAAKVLQVCFDEIDNARPFFIAILGDNYGWIPDQSIVEKCILGRNVESGDVRGKSVTEMEIVYGALKNSDPSETRFYFREIKNKKRGLFLNPDIPKHFLKRSSDDQNRMKELKRKIEKCFPNQTHTYSVWWDKNLSKFEGMDAFAETLYQDIKNMMIQRWGDLPELSEYEHQYYQYQYAIGNDEIAIDDTEPLVSSTVHHDNVILNESKMIAQNYLLISNDEHSLNILFSSLCRREQLIGSEIIPYECSQSIQSSSTDNMLRYFTFVLSKINRKNSQSLGNVCSDDETVAKLCAMLDDLDADIDHSVVLAIRNVHYLDRNGIFEWLPAKRYRNIRFIISSDRIVSIPSTFKSLTTEFYFQDSGVFSREQFIKSYMAKHHKEIDEKVYDALLDKANGKDDQYLEMLMQRICLLSQKDYEAIILSGDGMDCISQYLQKIVSDAPDNTPTFVLEQLSILESEIGSEFAKSVLAVLSILPYGISRDDLRKVLEAGGVTFSTLDMTLLCRRLPYIVNVTLDGYYRMIQTQVSKIITERVFVEEEKWTNILERYMFEKSENSELSVAGCVSDFYRMQYLDIAFKSGKKNVLGRYIKNIGFDVTYFGMVLINLVRKTEVPSEILLGSFSMLSFSETEWMVNELYQSLSDRKMLTNLGFSKVLTSLWTEMLSNLKKTKDRSERVNHCLFSLLFELGEMMFLNSMEDAEKYLVEAKNISEANFRMYPNRLWKMLRGVELTEKEKHMGYDGKDIPENSGVMFGFAGEVEDMEFEKSWSNRVRIINNYLSLIYRRKGNIKEAEELEKTSKTISHIADPDPLHTGQNELVNGITVIWPDEYGEEVSRAMKRRYKPDLRRNSALQIGKEAQRLYDAGKYLEAIKHYEESNEILYEIYEDGELGEYYDLQDVSGNADELRVMIQKECARDLSLNYHDLLGCVLGNEDDSRLFDFVDSMLEWAHIYDDYRNNIQSKGALEDDYLVSATIYFDRKDCKLFHDRIIRDIDRYYTYRLEAHLKGEKTDEKIMQNRFQANTILYETVISSPDVASYVTDILLSQSNATVKANDFNGFLSITELTESLLKWMWDNSYEWIGTNCSLEYIFFHNISNQCMIWEQHHMSERLKQDAERIVTLLDRVTETENILLAVQSVLRYAMQLFGAGEYQKIIPYIDAIFHVLQRTNDLPDVDLVNIYEKMQAMYSEAGVLDNAQRIAVYCELLLERMEQNGYVEELRKSNITPEQYKTFIVVKTITLYLNQAVALSRMEKQNQAENYLHKAEQLALNNSNIVAHEKDLLHRIEFFKRIGLPKPKSEEDPEKVFRKYKNEIETILSECLRKEPYDLSVLHYVVHLIEEMKKVPEYDIYKSTYTMAKYHHVLNMLFVSIGQKEMAYEMLKQAALLADSDNEKEGLYADIYSDMCAYTSNSAQKLLFSQKAMAIYEDLQIHGKDYSRNSYAMTLYNASIIEMERKQYQKALDYVKKASSIWRKLILTQSDEQAKAYISEAQRLTMFLEYKICQGE